MKWLRLALLLVMVAASARTMLLPAHAPAQLAPHEQLFAEFHENIKAGNFVPLWAQHLKHGFGEPLFEFHAPLPEYIAEAFFSGTHNAARALAYTGVLLIALAGCGMFLLARRISEEMACLAAGSYVLNPWFLRVACQGTGFESLAALALLPWLALTLVELAGDGQARAFPQAALSFAALAASNTTLAILVLPFLVATALVYRTELRNRRLLAGALLAGAAAAAFHWAPALGEKHFVKPVELAAEPVFVSLLAILSVGNTLGVLGLIWGLLRWSGTSPALAWRRGTQAFWKVALTLLLFTLISGYFTSRLSAVWHAALPSVLGPDSFLPLYLFFATLLGTVALTKECTKAWQWAGIATIIAATGALALERPSPDVPAPSNVTQHSTPITATMPPTAAAEAPLSFVQGRGEGKCDRPGPTRLDCEIMAVHRSLIRFNVLDYPLWHAVIDGKPSATTEHDAIRGMLQVELPPGNHSVRWRLEDTRLRVLAKWLSVLTLLALLVLLFKNQLSKRQTFTPESV